MDQKSEKTPPDRTPIRRWAKLRLWIGYIYLLCAVILAQPQTVWAIVGVALVIIGAVVRLISSATLVKDRELCTEGIYSITRNPLYLGSAFAALGFAAMTSSIWFPAAFILILLPLYIRMIILEEKYLGELYPKSYPDQCESRLYRRDRLSFEYRRRLHLF